MNIQRMYFTLPTGTLLVQWPDDITPEWLDFAEEVIAIQFRGVRRWAEHRAAEAAAKAEVLDV